MAVPTRKELWNAWLTLWNGNLSIADEIIAPTFVAHFAPATTSPAEVRGPAGLKQWIGGRAAPLCPYSFPNTGGPRSPEHPGVVRCGFRPTGQEGRPPDTLAA